MNPVRDDTATITCAMCGTRFTRRGRRRFCSDACRQTAWRRTHAAPSEPPVAKADTVYECATCAARFLGDQRCPDCNTFARRVGPGGPCPHCDEPIAISDLFHPEQLANRPTNGRR